MDETRAREERLARLSPRQRDVLRLRCQGLSHAEIAEHLVITTHTVKSHFQAIYEKLEFGDLNDMQRAVELQKYAAVMQNATGGQAAILLPAADREPVLTGSEAGEPEGDPLGSVAPEYRGLVAVLEDEVELLEQRSRALQVVVEQGRRYSPPRRNRLALSMALLAAIAVVGGLIGSFATLIATGRLGSEPPAAALAAATATSPVDTPAASATAMVDTPATAASAALAVTPTALAGVSPSPTGSPTGTAPAAASLCGEAEWTKPDAPPFLPSQGVVTFGPDTTNGAVLGARVRSVLVDSRGVWAGYFPVAGNQGRGLTLATRAGWATCPLPGAEAGHNINALAIDPQGRVWAGAEHGGVSMWDGTRWQNFTTFDGLPSNDIYGLTVDPAGDVWAATWEGVAKFEGKEWSVPYSVENRTIYSDHVHAVAFEADGNIWVGHINHGVSEYRSTDGRWVHHTLENRSGIGGNLVRSIVVKPAEDNGATSIWFATADGGVSRYQAGAWTVYRKQDGLPSDNVTNLALDPHGRVWAATDAGTAYYDGSKWVIYNTLHTLAIAFGPDCTECPYNKDNVWTGTEALGLTRSRLPYPDPALDLVSVRFFGPDGSELPDPPVLAPGDRFRPEITVRPRPPYQLKEERGDMLVHIDSEASQAFGAFPRIPVKGTIEGGEPFVFTDYDNFFVAPELPQGVSEQQFVSTWRVWMHTRMAGPVVPVEFTVRKP